MKKRLLIALAVPALALSACAETGAELEDTTTTTLLEDTTTTVAVEDTTTTTAMEDTTTTAADDTTTTGDVADEAQDLLGAIQASDQLQTLEAAIANAQPELSETLQDLETDYTVFAPTDDAFMGIGQDVVDAWFDAPQNLTEVLEMHVVTEELTAEELAEMETVETLRGETLTIEQQDGQLLINGEAAVVETIETPNGLVHVIDAVLVPEGAVNS